MNFNTLVELYEDLNSHYKSKKEVIESDLSSEIELCFRAANSFINNLKESKLTNNQIKMYEGGALHYLCEIERNLNAN